MTGAELRQARRQAGLTQQLLADKTGFHRLAVGYWEKKEGKFFQFDHFVYDSVAWQALKPGPRALYLEMKRRYNGYNNGEIFLSQRDAAKALNIGRDTVETYRAELVAKGFIIKTKGHHLGVAGVGKAALWALTEYPLGAAKPTYEFKAWKI